MGSLVTAPGTVETFVASDMDAPSIHPFLDGAAVVFTRSSPERDTPNEDAALLLQYGEGAGLLAVADGAGGTRGGGEAARIAVEAIRATLLDADAGEVPLRTVVLNSLELANRRICELGTGAGTTIVVAQLRDGHVRPFHVGDSMILVCGQRGRIRLQNVPHGPVGYGVHAGLIDESDAMHHEHRHLVSNLLGSDDMRIEIGSRLDLAARDTIVVASDGLSDNLLTSEIVDAARCGPIDAAARKLAEVSVRRMTSPSDTQPSAPDDLTFILFRRSR